MKNHEIYIGNNKLQASTKSINMRKILINNEPFYTIENYDSMAPFLMTIVSDGDQWMYISSTGGLTCGRKNAESSLFPYVTDDKVHDSAMTTGPDTHIMVTKDQRRILWSPFSVIQKNIYHVTRNMYKSVLGNKIIFEEMNHDLDLAFKYCWKYSKKYGFVRESELTNHSDNSVQIDILDGIRNLLPYGVTTQLQTTSSTLLDGYKRCELNEKVGLGIYTLSSTLTDKAEPSESLKATTVWSYGLDEVTYLLSENQVSTFCTTGEVKQEQDIKGKRGAYYVSAQINLDPQLSKPWFMIAELNQSAVNIEDLINEIKLSQDVSYSSTHGHLMEHLEKDIKAGDENLRQYVYAADGLQCTDNDRAVNRHFSNTLFNIMRGGLYAEGYSIDTSDLHEFCIHWNKPLSVETKDFFKDLPTKISYKDLLSLVQSTKNPHLERIIIEYLPITYSRRHGDPSRPWNKFNIDIAKKDGSRKLQFEGNWRDIFQNWEALSMSYPWYVEGIIAKFVNASTADGYNPYRITKDGIDWEVLDPDEPWSNIGYWGDHQLIYLLKLLELSKKYNGTKLDELLTKDIFVYANVPYRIVGIEQLMKDPRNSILFDDEVAEAIDSKVNHIGADGKLVYVGEEIYRANLVEKLLVTLLTKISNYVPEGGIWMNTQRPEWNDANNALVGYGLSMVTLYYLHRFLAFMEELLNASVFEKVEISEEVYVLFNSVKVILEDSTPLLGKSITDEQRFDIVKALGLSGEQYRQAIYIEGFSNKKYSLSKIDLEGFVQIASKHMKDSIKKNKREDKLYHAYNLINLNESKCQVSHLYEMLEGQVAVLSSKAITSEEANELLDRLKESQLYREDQNSYMLYPNKALPEFLNKNIIPKDLVEQSKVLTNELNKELSGIVQTDIHGKYRFDGKFRNGAELKECLLALDEYSIEDIEAAEEIFSHIFNHHEFTGRSGTFYKYEGLGCIYWHMVSKLLLAVQENVQLAECQEAGVCQSLADHYIDIKSGIGAEKTPEQYGAFPTDAYSHTPGFAGVQQPGMTGQVKEDIISRFGELGLQVKHGKIMIMPTLLHKDEFLKRETLWTLYDGENKKELVLKAGELGFTYCTVPFIYRLAQKNQLTVILSSGEKEEMPLEAGLPVEFSQKIFARSGEVKQVVVELASIG